MDLKIVLTGLGGQGVVFLTRLLANTAVALGHPVLVSETHGMSQRGGSVVSHLKISGNLAPLIQPGSADVMLALDPDEAARNMPLVKSGGSVFVNTEDSIRPEVIGHLKRLQIKLLTIPASRIALELGSAAVANVALAGFTAADPGLGLPIEEMRSTLQQTASRGLELNMKALDSGYLYAQTLSTGNPQNATL